MTSNGVPPIESWLPAYEQDLTNRAKQMQATFTSAVQADPALARRQADYARRLGLPDTAPREPEFIQRFAREEALQSAARSTATASLRARYRDYSFVQRTHDDLPALQRVDGAFGWLGANWRQGRLQAERGFLGAQLAAGMADDADRLRLADIDKALALAPENTGLLSFLGEATDILGYWSSTIPTSIAAGAVTATPGLLAGPGAPVASGIGFGTGFVSASVAQAGLVEGGNAYLDYIAAGYDEEAARNAAIGVGIVNGALEGAGLKMATGPVIKLFGKVAGRAGSAALTKATAGAAWGEFARSYATAIGGEVGTEVLQEITNIAGEELLRTYTRPELVAKMATERGRNEVYGRIMDVAEKTAKGMLLLGLPGPGGNFYVDSRRAEAATRQTQFLRELADGSAASKLRADDPATFKSLAQDQADEGGVGTLYVDRRAMLDVLRQVEPEDVTTKSATETLADKLPTVAAQLEVEGSGDVQISTGDFATHIAGTKLGDALMAHLRVDQSALSEAEATQYAPVIQQQAAKAKELLAKDGDEVRGLRQQVSAIYQDVVQQIRALEKKLPDEEVRLNARLYTNFVTVQADRAGVTPAEFHAQYRLKVGAATGEQFRQVSTDSPEFRNWFGESRVVDADGKPLVVYSGQPRGDGTIGKSERNEMPFGHAFFSDSREVASRYSGSHPSEKRGKVDGFSTGRRGVTVRAHLAMSNPWDLDGFSSDAWGDEMSSADMDKLRRWAGEASGWDESESEFTAELVDLAYTSKVVGQGYSLESALNSSPDGKMALMFPDAARAIAQREGYDGVTFSDGEMGGKTLVPFDPTQIKSVNNRGTFDPNDPNILRQTGDDARGTFSPSSLTISLAENADSSTFLHELGHYFLTVYDRLAAQEDASQEVKDDFAAVLKWFGVEESAWRAMSLDEQRRYHEQFAYNFELYLFEGKAPAPALTGMFRRFRDWLVRVYKSMTLDSVAAAYRTETGLELPALSDEVRQVMDRMVAADNAIKAASAIYSAMPLFQSEAVFVEMGGTAAEYQTYAQAIRDRDEEAVEELTQRMLRNLEWYGNARGKVLKKLQAKHAKMRDAARAEVAEAVAERRPYRALAWLKGQRANKKKGVESTPGNKLHRLLVGGLIPPDTDAKVIEPFLADDGMAPDVAAQALGYEGGGAEMIAELLAAPPITDAVETELGRRMEREHGDIMSPQAIERAVDHALHTEARARIVATELRLVDGATTPMRVFLASAKLAAEQAMEGTKVSDLRPHQFTIAEQRAARAAFLAMGKEPEKVIGHKRRQMRFNSLAKAAEKASDEVAKAVEDWRKFAASDEKIAKKRDLPLVNAARAILAAFDAGGTEAQKRAIRARSTEFLRQLEEYDPPRFDDIRALIDQAAAGAMDYQDLTFAEFRLLRDTVEGLWHAAERVRKVMVNGQAVDRDTAVAELRGRIADRVAAAPVRSSPSATDAEKRLRGFQSLRSMARRMESALDAIDGPDGPGPFTRYLWRPIQTAIDNYRTMRNQFVREFVALFDGLGKLPANQITLSRTGAKFNGKAELLGALANTGNKSNKASLLIGAKWTDVRNAFDDKGNLNSVAWDADIADLERQGVITEADWDFVQALWDLADRMKPAAQQAHMALYGRFFDEVKPDGFTKTLADGTTKEYRGGYFPKVFEEFANADARAFRDMDELEANQRNMFPTTGKGFTMRRVQDFSRPLSVDLRKFVRHIDQVARFAHVQPALRDAMNLMRDEGLRNDMQAIDPTFIDGVWTPWLNRVAQQRTGEAGMSRYVDGFWRAIRQRTGMATMFANVSNALQQLTGWFPAMLKVNGSYLRGALWRYMRSPQEVTGEVAAASPFMANRLQSQIFDMQEALNDLLTNPNAYQKIRAYTNRHAYFLQSAFQNTVDVTTWVAAHEQALVNGASERDAVHEADAAVRLTQGGTNPEQVSRFEAGTPFIKTITQFQGYFNMLANLNVTEIGKILRDLRLSPGAKTARLMTAFVLGFAAPMLVADAIARTLGEGWDDGDDDGHDELAEWFFGGMARGALAMIPLGGNIAVVALNSWNNKPYDDRMMTSPSASAIEGATVGVVRAVAAALDPDRDVSGKNIRDVLTLMTLILGVPVSALGRPIGYARDASTGKIDPTSPIDYGRGLVTGRASEASR